MGEEGRSMDDNSIICLFFSRNENAVSETQNKYGGYIRTLAFNITEKIEDAEECENDTYIKLWNSIPPENPLNFKAYIGRIARNCALSRFRYQNAAKRDIGISVILSELEDCIPSSFSVEDEVDAKELSSLISSWLYALTEENRVLFIRRYWYGESLKDLALRSGMSVSKLTSRMFSLRKQLKKELEQKGVYL